MRESVLVIFSYQVVVVCLGALGHPHWLLAAVGVWAVPRMRRACCCCQPPVKPVGVLPAWTLRQGAHRGPGLGEVNHHLGVLSATSGDGDALRNLGLSRSGRLGRPMKEPVCSLRGTVSHSRPLFFSSAIFCPPSTLPALLLITLNTPSPPNYKNLSWMKWWDVS